MIFTFFKDSVSLLCFNQIQVKSRNYQIIYVIIARGVVRGVAGVARATPIFQVLFHNTLSSKALKPLSPQALKSTSPQILKPKSPQTLKPTLATPI